MSEHQATEISSRSSADSGKQRKRPAGSQPVTDPRYPRKRSLKACHVCRSRKTKCDNVRPTCGFCASIGITCSYDDAEKDHSTFDPASLEILRQLGHIISSQDDMLRLVRSITTPQAKYSDQPLSTPSAPQIQDDTLDWDADGEIQQQLEAGAYDWFGQPQPDSASTTPAASTSVAAVRWFGLLASHDPLVSSAVEHADDTAGTEAGFLDLFNGQNEDDMTPLQRATKIIDGQPPEGHLFDDEEAMWKAPVNIPLLGPEQGLFEHFLHRICSWLDLFDLARHFSTRVPHLAIRNAGLLNAILALSGYHQSINENLSPDDQRTAQNTALQYYYQTLHYVQKAMQYSTYKNSLELMATTLIVSTYEMLRGSRRDWQQHLQGVFWILRSRQIEVEASSLESTTWWAWLRQDIWVAFRERRRTYSTWLPKKSCAELGSYELASRAIWILAQVVNFCAAADGGNDAEVTITGRIGWAKALRKMLHEWEMHLTVEFSQLPATSRDESDVFKPRLIHPQCFGLAMQIHHVSRILICAHEPNLGGLDSFMNRHKTIQDSVEVVCGIGMTLTEDASSMMSSQCLFIAGMFIHNTRQRAFVLDMLDSRRGSWPTPTLGAELQEVWNDPKSPWASL